MNTAGFAVIDVETTGFGATDRILEIGVVLADPKGNIEDRWSTLINPDRDIPNTFVHGVSGREVIDAPKFENIAAEFLAVVDGRRMVAHNAPFDTRMLGQELRRLGVDQHAVLPGYLCTMSVTGTVNPDAGRSLSKALARVGITNANAHTALADAEATAHLLHHYIVRNQLPNLNTIPVIEANMAKKLDYNSVPPFHREHVEKTTNGSWIGQLAADVPFIGKDNVDSYMETLERSMLDLELSQHEVAELLEVAAELGLGREEVQQLHEDFLRSLALLAWADGVVTEQEEADLYQAARALSVDSAVVADAVAQRPDDAEAPTWGLEPGDRVTFTGKTDLPRTHWEKRATEAGLVAGSLTKNTKLLVAADTDSLSRKAKKAREYEIPIVGEKTFAKLLGKMPQIATDVPAASAANAALETVEESYAEQFYDGDEGGVASEIYTATDWQPTREELLDTIDLAQNALELISKLHLGLDTSMKPRRGARVLSPRATKIVARLRDENGAYQKIRQLRRGTAASVLTDFLSGRDERDRAILVQRIAARDKATLDELGEQFGITRERIRQLEKPLLAETEQLLQEDAIADLREAIAAHAYPVGNLDRILSAFPELGATVPGWDKKLYQIIDELDDSFVITQGWVCFPTLSEAAERTKNLLAEKTNEHGVVPFEWVADHTELLEEELREWLVHCGFTLFNGHVLTKTGSLPDRAAAVLSIKQQPMTVEEIFDSIGQERTIRSLGNALAASDVTVKNTSDTWALKEWGLEEYTGVNDAIRSRMEAAISAGEEGVPMEALVAELPEKFHVAEGTVRIYGAKGDFELIDGVVVPRRNPMQLDSVPEESSGLYQRDGRWQLLITVGHDHLRGSGFGVPSGVLSMLGATFGEPLTLPSDDGPQTFYWNSNSTSIGTIKRLLDAQNIEEGERVWLDFHNGERFSIERARPTTGATGMNAMAEHVGADPVGTDEEIVSRVSQALGLGNNAPKRKILSRFRHRGDNEIVELLERTWI